MDKTVRHKSTSEGLARQIEILAQGSGIAPIDIASACKSPIHDCVDALLGAWVASTDAAYRVAFGDGGRDTIWTVRSETNPVVLPNSSVTD